MAKKKKNSTTEQDNSGISKNKVKIRVYMRFGADTRQKRAEYIAEETRDAYNNLVVRNDKYQHNEDVDFSQDEVYHSMSVTLGLEGSNKEQSLKKLDSAILRYAKRVEAITRHPELNAIANIWDEKRKLKELKLYRNYATYRSPTGAYYTIENGMRVYDFESIDGFLIPIWHGCDNLTDYPDYTREKKITMQETAEFKTFLDAKKKQNMKYASLFMLMIILAILTGVMIFAIFKVLSYHNEAVDQWEKPAQYCASQTASIVKSITTLFNDDIVKGCLLATNKSDVINGINDKIKELPTNK